MSEMSAAEAEVVARFDAAEPAPESWRGDDGWNVLGGTHDRTVIDDRGEFVCEARDAQTAALIAALSAKADAADRVTHCDHCLHVKAGPHQTVDAEAEWAALNGDAPC